MHTSNTFTILLDLMETIFKLYIFQKIIVSRNFFFKNFIIKNYSYCSGKLLTLIRESSTVNRKIFKY